MNRCLCYDREYRKLQSGNSFRWVTDIPHLQTVHLRPRQPAIPQPQQGRAPNQVSRTPQGEEIFVVQQPKTVQSTTKKLREVPTVGIDRCLTAREKELADGQEKLFIISGLKHGFDIIDPNAQIKPVEVDNHVSASTANRLYHKDTEQINLEIENGNYILVDEPPTIVSPIAVIPKSDGGIRQ